MNFPDVRTSIEAYVTQGLEAYVNDPAETPYQKGYLAALIGAAEVLMIDDQAPMLAELEQQTRASCETFTARPPYSETAVDAMCLWEACLEDERVKAIIEPLRENVGTCTMRDAIARLAPQCGADFRASEAFGNESFDWDYAPRWLAEHADLIRDSVERVDRGE